MGDRAFSGARAVGTGSIDVAADGRASITGSLSFATVSVLLPVGTKAIEEGRVATIDLAGVTASDSAGLALLIEWLSVARSAGHPLLYENIPAQLRQLARLSEVWPLISGEAQVEGGEVPACGSDGAPAAARETAPQAESTRDQAP